MKFKRTKRIAELIDRLYPLVRDRKRGHTVPHELIVPVLGVEPHEKLYQYCIEQVRKRLRDDRGIALWPVPGVGYKLLTEEEQIRIPYAVRMRRARRQCRKVRDDLECLPTDNLSLHQQIIRAHRLDQTVETERAIGQKLRQQAQLDRVTPTIPRRVP